MGGNDTITGNGNTRSRSTMRPAACTVDLAGRHGDRRCLGRHRHLHAASATIARLALQRQPVRQQQRHRTSSTSMAAPATTSSTAAAASTGDLQRSTALVTAGITRQHGGRHGDRRRRGRHRHAALGRSRCAAPTSPTPTMRPASAARALERRQATARFNEFEGMGGNDTITGNGNTRIAFFNATARRDRRSRGRHGDRRRVGRHRHLHRGVNADPSARTSTTRCRQQ